MRILILKWERLCCQALAAIVQRKFQTAEVVIEQRARNALRLLRIAPVAFAVLGVDAPDLDGLDFIPEIIDRHLARRSIIICERVDRRTLSALRRLPYDGLIDASSADTGELELALEQIANGERHTSSVLHERLREFGSLWQPQLSPREEVVLSALGEGLDNEEAAIRLGLSPATIRSHRTHIMGKLSLHHKGQLIEYALVNQYVRYTEEGILHPGFESDFEPPFDFREQFEASRAG